MSHDYVGLFETWEIAIAKKLVREFKQTWTCLRKEDQDDLMQEVLAHWYFVKAKYDPTKEARASTFMMRVLRAKLQDIVRLLGAKKRKIDHTALSLDQPSQDEEEASILSDEILKEEPTQPESASQAELQEKMKALFRKLAPEEKKLCGLIRSGATIKSIARKLGKHRSMIYRDMERLRKLFEAEGLKEFLK